MQVYVNFVSKKLVAWATICVYFAYLAISIWVRPGFYLALILL